MTPNDLHALQLLAALQEVGDIDLITNADQTPTVRVTIRTPDGEYIGEAVLGIRGTDEATKALGVVAEYALRKPLANQPAATPDADPVLHPQAIGEIEDLFAAIEPESFLDDVFGSRDAEASLAAYEELVSGEWDGGGVL
ncbi:hypothetical protein ACWCPT_29365 [Streptomyces sp. NPDC002308]